MSSYNACYGPQIDSLVDKILIIIAWGHTLCDTGELANKNHPIDSYREQHSPNRRRFKEREGLLVIKQGTPET